MEIGRFLLAIVLTVAVIILTNLLFPPAPAPPAGAAVDSVLVASPPAAAADSPAAAVPAPVTPQLQAPPQPATAVDTIVVRTPLYRFAFSSLGGALVSAELLRYESFTREGAVQLVPVDRPLVATRAVVGERQIDFSRAVLEPDRRGELVLAEGDSAALTFRGSVDGVPLELTWRFSADAYEVELEGRLGASADAGARLLLELGPTLAVNEANAGEDYRALAYVVNGPRDGIESVRLSSVDQDRIEEGPLHWVALKNKYFVAAMLAREGQPFGGVIARDVPGEHTAQLTATLPLPTDRTFSVRLYLGPQEAERLAAVGAGLEDVNPYGWRLFRPIIRPLAHLITWALTGMHNVLGIGYGWVLVLFGVLVRIVLWPLNAKAGRAQLKNMALQPRMKEIQTKYKADPQRMQQEMLRLYKEEGFNPLGGCLPLLIPFPVLITLFFVFQATIEFRGVEFLWLPDLSQKDPLYVLPILMGVSMFAMQYISLKSMSEPNPQMKMMMWFMPAFMVIIFINLASGLNLYYASSNIASIPQQIQLRNERLRAQAARPPAPKPQPVRSSKR